MKDVFSHVFSIPDLKTFRQMLVHVIGVETARLALGIEQAQEPEDEAKAIEHSARQTSFFWVVHDEVLDLLNGCLEGDVQVAVASTDKDVHDFFFAVAYAPQCDAGSPRMQSQARALGLSLDHYAKSVERIRQVVDKAPIKQVPDDDGELSEGTTFSIPDPGVAQ